MLTTIKTFLQRETAAGIVLFFAAVLAVIFANTGLIGRYQTLWALP